MLSNPMPSSPRMQPVAVRDALVVDADQDLKELISGALQSGAWAVRYVPTNAVALEAVKGKAFELIITSEKTSAKQDIELLRKIRAIRPHVRLIILAKESSPLDVLTAIREHAFSYFSKPYTPEQLEQMIHLAIKEPAWDDGIEIRTATAEWIQLAVRCQVLCADRLLQFMKEITDLPEDERYQVGVALREMLLNAMEHGGGLDPNSYVEVEYVRAKRMVSCRIADPGPGFTLDEIPHAAVANPADDPIRHAKVRDEIGLRPGGLGIMLAQHMLDQVLFGQNGNEVLLIKYLDRTQKTPA